MRFRGQRHRFPFDLGKIQKHRRARIHGPTCVGPRLVATDVFVRDRVEVAIENTRETRHGIRCARRDIVADLVRFKYGTQAVIVVGSDRVIFVIVALGAIGCQAQKRLGCVFNRLIHPCGAVEQKILTG